MEDLRKFHTFSLPSQAKKIEEVTSLSQLKELYAWALAQSLPFLFLGQGSNVLFVQDFNGVVAINKLQGLECREDNHFYYLHVAGGETWHNLVTWAVDRNMGGLENLALIPGCVGSAPVQNIGAYGVEFQDVCDYVDVLDLATQTVSRLSKRDCQFGYRDSIFKQALKDRAVIVSVGLKLAKNWQPKLAYGELKSLPKEEQTIRGIYQKICRIRQQKLPNPAEFGNAGSFFKNPVISSAQFLALSQHNANLPHYPQEDGQIKLPAGWLIDQCGLKGTQIGGAKVNEKQALVLMNTGNATVEDVVNLAKHVRQSVWEKFHIALEPEVRFIGRNGEINATDHLS